MADRSCIGPDGWHAERWRRSDAWRCHRDYCTVTRHKKSAEWIGGTQMPGAARVGGAHRSSIHALICWRVCGTGCVARGSDGWHAGWRLGPRWGPTQRALRPDTERIALGPETDNEGAAGHDTEGPDPESTGPALRERRCPTQRAPGRDTESAGPRHRERRASTYRERRALT